MRTKGDNVLVVAAHPDDETLGCGGAVVRHARAGHNVSILILGEGITSRHNRGKNEKCELQALKKQAAGAAGILGAGNVYFSNYPDNKFDSVPLLRIIKEVERVMAIVRPRIVYTHHYGDLNIDHRIAYQAVLTACRPVKGGTVREIYSFEVPSSTEWAGPAREAHFMPDRFIDISGALNLKMRALRCYKSETRAWPHPRSEKYIGVLAAKRGAEAGLARAEAFETIRVIIE